jgi:CheY-like chemotaxis protein
MDGEDKRPQVLVVDDSQIIRLVLCKYFERMGIRAVSAESGSRAIELFKGNTFRVIVSDLDMPGMDGVELAKNLLEIGCQSRLFCYSAWIGGQIGSKALLYFDKLFEKPNDMSQLVYDVKSALQADAELQLASSSISVGQ